jgi:hypothetical protein
MYASLLLKQIIMLIIEITYCLCYKSTLSYINYSGHVLSFIADLFNKIRNNHKGVIMVT